MSDVETEECYITSRGCEAFGTCDRPLDASPDYLGSA